MGKNDWLVDKLRNLDDEAFVEVVGEITERSAVTEVKANDDIIHITQLEEEIQDEYKNWGKVRGLRTGYKTLDQRIGGMGKGDVVLIGGETSNGKSALAANIAVNVARTNGVLFITLEMKARQIGSRIYHINDQKVNDLDMMFQSEPRLTYKDIKPLIQRAKDEGNVELVVLDYLQYLGRGMKNEEVAIMSKEMKTIALEFDIPMVIIVSLRKGEGGKSKRAWTDIEIEDLMGTGSIGYDADTVLIASRKDMDNEFQEDKLYVKVLKTRNARLDYNNRYIEFEWNGTKISDSEWDKALIANDGFEEVQ